MKRFRVSQTLVINTLCSVIGPLLAWNAAWLWAYRRVLYELLRETIQCGIEVSHWSR